MTKTRIQIVEDEEIVASHLELSLENLGYCVTSVSNSGEEALVNTEAERPDIVLMDINLAGEMDGIDTAEEIYSNFNIPIIYLTAHSAPKTLNRAKKTEPFGYIIKPFDDKELYSSIEIALHKHQAQNKLNKLAYFDTLTGLPNRNVFFDRLNQQINASKRCNKVFALLFLDLDKFKPINDNYGHDIGDKLLQEAARRLSGCVRKSDTVARTGGDEFSIILSDLSSTKDVDIVARKIILSLGTPFDLKEHKCSIGVSIGISIYPSDGTDPENLIKNADLSMYNAKKRGGNLFFIHSKDEITIEILIAYAADFVVQNRGLWDHNMWIEFIHELQKKGFDISERIQFNVGLLLESFKIIYRPLENEKNTVSVVAELSVNFVKGNRGIWGHREWEGHLKSLRCDGYNVTEEDHIHIGNILEVIKGLYLSLENKEEALRPVD